MEERIRINNWSVSLKGDKVEFWHIVDRLPSFIARHNVETILEHDSKELKLDPNVSYLKAKDYEMAAIVCWLKGVTK